MATASPVPILEAPELPDVQRQAQARLDAEILRVARDRFRQAADHESQWRQVALEDAKFAAGDQWGDAGELRRREERVCLTINQIPKFLRQVTNDQRQNRPAIRIRPVDSQSDPKTAEVLQGLIRHIEYDSDADVAYDTAFDAAVRKGRGYWRVLIDYTDPYSFEQSIQIQRILNDFSVYVDPAGRWTPDYAAMDWAFVIERMPRERFCQLYEVTPTQYAQWYNVGDGWLEKDEVRVAEYFYRESQPILLVQLAPDVTRYVQLQPPEHPGMELPEPSRELLTIVQQRMRRRGIAPLQPAEYGLITSTTLQRKSALPVIWWLKITGAAVLERTVWPGEEIPIVPVLGEELVIEGQIDYRGLVRDTHDAQRMYNFWATCEAETITLAPKAPYIGAEGQFESHEAAWTQANLKSFGYLQYRPVSLAGTLVPAPQRQALEPPIQAITIARQQAEHDLNSTTGIYPPALGQRSNETSGRAIRARQAQSQMGNFHFFGNLLRALRRTGRILVDLIPHIYTSQRVVRILGEDDTQQMVLLQPGAPRQQPASLPPGIAGIYDVTVGRYDVMVEAGPSYATKRAEAADWLTQMAQAWPDLMAVAGDVVFATQDAPGADLVSKRLKKRIPPELLDEQPGNPEQMVQQLQGQMQQMGQQLQALNAYAQECEQQLQQAMQELEALKEQTASKQAELTLKQQEIQLDHQAKMAEVELKRQELLLKRDELHLEAQRVAMEMERQAPTDELPTTRGDET